ncbi:hypothetical protein BA187_14300 [Serratia marcescens]|nr:hypothetical protein BA187_14300 [Serratia marcescens]
MSLQGAIINLAVSQFDQRRWMMHEALRNMGIGQFAVQCAAHCLTERLPAVIMRVQFRSRVAAFGQYGNLDNGGQAGQTAFYLTHIDALPGDFRFTNFAAKEHQLPILALAGDIAGTKGGHEMAVGLKGDELFRAQLG